MDGLQTFWEKSFSEKKYRLQLHVIFWIVYLLVLLVVGYFVSSSLLPKWHFQWNILAVSFLSDLVLVGTTYYLAIFLSYRNIFVRKKYFLGLFYLLICVFVYINLFYFFESFAVYLIRRSGNPVPPTLESMSMFLDKGYFSFMTIPIILLQVGFSYFYYIFFPVCCKFLRDQMRMQKKQNELQKKNVQLEMDFLKAQIHPHFLFNTLNNIYSLITHNENKKSAEMVSGLSSLLRYALYDGRHEFFSLEQEVSMIKNFIALEEVRSDDLKLQLHWPEKIPSVKIPPFLLLPLIENAFKHGANSQLSHPCVRINMKINDQELFLEVENSFDPEYRRKNAGGLGLLNLKKRLDYYYHENYRLETGEKNNIFLATLNLPLTCQPNA